MHDTDTQRGWTKLKSRSKAKKAQPGLAKMSNILDIIGLTTADEEAEIAADTLEVIGQTMMDRGVMTQAEMDECPAFIDQPVSAVVEPKRARRKLAIVNPSAAPELPAPGVMATIEEIKDRFAPKAVAEIAAPPKLKITEPKAEEPFRLPTISRAQLAAMFANMQENGMTLEDFN